MKRLLIGVQGSPSDMDRLRELLAKCVPDDGDLEEIGKLVRLNLRELFGQ